MSPDPSPTGAPVTLRLTRGADGTVTGIVGAFAWFPIRLSSEGARTLADAIRAVADGPAGTVRDVAVRRL